ncbi:Zn-binding domain-containing protein [Rothia endophytica]|uniref:Zn-binding domain-containing protein n=1 Tax=Rothia endophytica TaxID=1324766 RepID=UPI001F21B460|nr:DEAD/DEAH box helicase [Rothia endophytica]
MLQRLGYGSHPPQITHVQTLAAQEAVTSPWPEWAHPRVVEAYQFLGVDQPYRHQVEAADAAHSSPGNRHVILATGTASGKSLGYQLPALDAIYRGEIGEGGAGFISGRATALYLSPTKALAADQLASLRSLNLPGLVPETYDGDTPAADRRFIRERANLVLCNPDMLHHAILPNHGHWSVFLRKLRYVIIDEAHSYRGVFGAHVAVLLRRLRRICRHYGVTPVFIGASATSAEPAASFSRLIGSRPEAVTAVTESTAPRGATHVVLWEPEFDQSQQVTDRLSAGQGASQAPGGSGGRKNGPGENGAPVRKSVITQTAEMLTDLVIDRTRTIAFIKSRRGAEAIAQTAGRFLDEVEPGLSSRVSAYRAGYLPEERRELERTLRSGQMLGVASTSALELGIDIAGLDAVLVAGWPGTRSSFFQQIGRAGRAGQDSFAVLVASEDPLDTYLVHHPADIFETGVEKTVFDPENPYVLSPHLCAAAAELPLRPEELIVFGATAPRLLEKLVEQGYLRRRPTGWFWTHPESASALVSLRGGSSPLQIIEVETGAVVGTMDGGSAHAQGHPGAIYTHQGETFLVEDLDEENRVIAVSRATPDYYTQARDITEVTVLATDQTVEQGPVTMNFGSVRVRSQVVGYQRKSLIGQQVLGDEPLDLEPQSLNTRAIWWTIPATVLHAAGIHEREVPGALHAAEHAAIGLLPLTATCDRWDIGGLSTALHVDTEQPTIFVYDGHPGGAGFAERGFEAAEHWLRATLDTILACECERGCPSCVQSPKCGNRNEPLEKDAAARLLGALLVHAGAVTEDENRAHLKPLIQREADAGRAPQPVVSAVEALTGQHSNEAPF